MQNRELPNELQETSILATIGALVFDWCLIAGAISLALYRPSLASFALAQVIVATRQHALFLIMHEGTHGLLCRDRFWNEWISDIFSAWPVGVSTDRYRKRHWLHHRFLNSDQDPDWARKKDAPSWKMPCTKWNFWKNALPYLCGKGIVEMFYATRALGVEKKDWPFAVPFYSAIAIILTLVGGWKAFCVYWALPYFTILPFLHRLRYSAEHLALPWKNTLSSTRNVTCSAIENFFFSPHNGSFHLVHHSFPHVPWHQLKNAHKLLCKEENYRIHASENTSYFFSDQSVYRDLTHIDSKIEEPTPTRSAA